jgi:hypothetical protein
LPVVSKTEAMLHPENLNVLCSAAAVASATTILVTRRFSGWLVGCLTASVAIGLATRASMLFVLVTLVLAFGVSIGSHTVRRLLPWRPAAVGLATLVLAGLVLMSYRVVRHHSADPEASSANFFSLSIVHIFTQPWRPNFPNQALPETYSDLWGDWFGGFTWSVYAGAPSEAAKRLLKDQSLIGVLPTALAVTGWLSLVWGALRRRRELAVVALLPAIALAGYLARSWLALTKDGDLFKATYLVNTAPVWALSFGLATAWLATRSRLMRYGMVVLFAVFAVLELRFTLYGIRDNHPIF